MARSPGKSNKTRRERLAQVLIWAFVAQSLFRLSLMVPLYRTGFSSPVVHAMTLAVCFALCALVVTLWQGRKSVRRILSFLLAILWVILGTYDVNAIVAAAFGSKPLTLTTLAGFYCGQKSWLVCAANYPRLMLTIVVPAILLVAALTWLIAVAFDAIVATVSAGFNAVDRGLRRKSGIGAAAVLAVVCLIDAVAWIAAPWFMAIREPITFIVYLMPFEDGPKGLIDLPRPDYRVEPTPGAQPRTLVLITVDSLRHDYVGLDPGKPTETPFLRSLAQSGKLHDFGPAAAICASSYCGIAAILSSSGWAALDRGPPLVLPDVLAANGYQVHFLLSGPHVMANLREIYGPNITTFRDDLSPDSAMRFDDREQVRRLEQLRIADPAKTFIGFHLMSPHAVGWRFQTGAKRDKRFSINSAMLPSYRRHYAAGVRQADEIIRQIFATLARKGLLADALVIITADHGERLGVPGKQSHGGDFDRWTTAVPLLVYDAAGGDWPNHGLTTYLDIAPTFADAAGIGIPQNWQGKSLMAPIDRPAVPVDSVHAAGMVGLLDGRRLLFRCEVKTGATIVMPLDGPALGEAARARALAAAPALYASLERRRDAERCFRASFGARGSGP